MYASLVAFVVFLLLGLVAQSYGCVRDIDIAKRQLPYMRYFPKSVFISYRTQNSQLAEEVKHFFEVAGFHVFMWTPDEPFHVNTAHEIYCMCNYSSFTFIVKPTENSKWMTAEENQAKRLRKKIFYISHETCLESILEELPNCLVSRPQPPYATHQASIGALNDMSAHPHSSLEEPFYGEQYVTAFLHVITTISLFAFLSTSGLVPMHVQIKSSVYLCVIAYAIALIVAIFRKYSTEQPSTYLTIFWSAFSWPTLAVFIIPGVCFVSIYVVTDILSSILFKAILLTKIGRAFFVGQESSTS